LPDRTELGTLKNSQYEQELRRLIAVDLLIVDDFGLDALDPTESRDTYEILNERHRSGSIIVTSNRGPDEWLATFADPLRAQSAIDRFVNNTYDHQERRPNRGGDGSTANTSRRIGIGTLGGIVVRIHTPAAPWFDSVSARCRCSVFQVRNPARAIASDPLVDCSTAHTACSGRLLRVPAEI